MTLMLPMNAWPILFAIFRHCAWLTDKKNLACNDLAKARICAGTRAKLSQLDLGAGPTYEGN